MNNSLLSAFSHSSIIDIKVLLAFFIARAQAVDTSMKLMARDTRQQIIIATISIFILLSSMVVGYDYIISNLCWTVKSIIERV